MLFECKLTVPECWKLEKVEKADIYFSKDPKASYCSIRPKEIVVKVKGDMARVYFNGELWRELRCGG